MLKLGTILAISALIALGAALPHSSRKLRLDSRIVGGDETTIEENPWQVSIQLLGLHSCGGSIISQNTIVTAAHCVDELLLFLYNVRVGTSDLREGGQSVGIDRAIVHEQYSGVDYDIALIKLSEDLNFTDTIQPINLPQLALETGTDVNVTGWGVTSEGGLFSEDILRSVTVQIVDSETCNEAYSQYYDVTDRMLCAGVPEGGKDACQGDSGGPLVVDGVLYGLTSWGLGCAEKGYPGVYTNVVNLVHWINTRAGIL